MVKADINFESGKNDVDFVLDGKDFWVDLQCYAGMGSYDHTSIKLTEKDAKKLAIWLATKLIEG